jgi:hypothetical protein
MADGRARGPGTVSSNLPYAIEYTETLRKRAARSYRLRSCLALLVGLLAGSAIVRGSWWSAAINFALALYWGYMAESARDRRDRHEKTLLTLRTGAMK